ncbi:unnamed protein product [Rangifer tarandus platyrhynchus]|uniref:Uncharacterized protein n=1 Tax=Rangifer tarandus platyrhynchus TaxID=3082113 RepID=A0AC59ZNJ8_RANTA
MCRDAVTAAGVFYSFTELMFAKSLPCTKPHAWDGAMSNITGQVSCQRAWLEKQKRSNYKRLWDFPAGPVVKNLSCNAGDAGLIPENKDPTCHRAIKPSRSN